jgi:polyhydroxyalkanoate synthesis regulator protein
LIRSINYPDDPPTKFNELMNKKGHLFASIDELHQINSFYGSIIQSIVEAEESGDLVVTDQQYRFPRIGDHLYEPIDNDWICAPIYCQPSSQ